MGAELWRAGGCQCVPAVTLIACDPCVRGTNLKLAAPSKLLTYQLMQLISPRTHKPWGLLAFSPSKLLKANHTTSEPGFIKTVPKVAVVSLSQR